MNDREIDRLADVVLYEGYLLYPYRPSVKNVRRWTFGGVGPRVHAEATGGRAACLLRTEVLVAGPGAAMIRARTRFLQVEHRLVGKARERGGAEPSGFMPVEHLEVDGVQHYPWQEGVKREAALDAVPLSEIAGTPFCRELRCPASRGRELLRDSRGAIVGDLVRDQAELRGELRLTAVPLGEELWRLTFSVENRSAMVDARDGEEAERRSFMATHTLLQAEGGHFVSLTDPPPACAEAARACSNLGTWPVLLGSPGEDGVVLGSPIILPDHPQIAPESPGDLFDCTETDEILSLRIRTLAETERRAITALDPRGRELLARTESLARRELASLHGTWRPSRGGPGAT